jgi:hypothetical protein
LSTGTHMDRCSASMMLDLALERLTVFQMGVCCGNIK